MPLDPAYPRERLAHVVADIRMRRGPDTAAGDLGAAARAGRVRSLRSRRSRPACPSHRPRRSLRTTSAYVIHTSGSTGRPKGVPIPQAALLNMVDWHARTYGLTADDRVAQVTAIGFDAAVGEIWPALAAGASLHIAGEETGSPPKGCSPGWPPSRSTLAVLPTALAELFLELAERRVPPGLALRTLLIGGDRLKRFRIRRPAGFAWPTTTGRPRPPSSPPGRSWRAGRAIPSGCPRSAGRSTTRGCTCWTGSCEPVPAGVPGELCDRRRRARAGLSRAGRT